MRRGIICGGCILVDVNKSIDCYPAEERLAMIESESTDTGGPGLNLAVDLVKLGAPFPVEVIGMVGDDEHGRLVLERCQKAGIRTAGLRVLAGVPTSHTDVMIVKGSGRRTFFHHQGANARLLPAQFDFTETTARILHIGAPGLHDAMDQTTDKGNGFSDVLANARAAGLRTNMEMVTLPPERTRLLVRPCLPLLDTLVINELEAAALSEVETHRDGVPDFDRAEAAARRLIELGVHELTVVHFPSGAVAAGRDGRVYRHGSVRVPSADVKSTNGAGDAFASGVMLGIHEGWPVERCLEAGVCVAAVSLGAYSTSGAIRPIEECIAYGRRHGYRETAPPRNGGSSK